MNCVRLRQLLDGWMDGEIDGATGAEIETHLAACPNCASVRTQREGLRALVHEHAPRHRLPEAFAAVVRSRLAPSGATAGYASRGPNWWQALTLACGCAVLGLVIGLRLASPPLEEVLREQVVASHVAALQLTRALTEVASGDRHAIKPWFEGKLDFAPPVLELTADGFVLVGARLDHIADRQAAAVVYRLRNHTVNLFVWRTSTTGSQPALLVKVRGYGVVTWRDGGLEFAVVSDADPRDLKRFARIVQATP